MAKQKQTQEEKWVNDIRQAVSNITAWADDIDEKLKLIRRNAFSMDLLADRIERESSDA